MPPRVAPKKATVVTRAKPQGRRQEEKNIQEDFDHNDDDSENNDEQMNKFDRPLDINLEQDIARMMLPVNPQAPSNLSYYNFKDREWKKDELIDQLSIHFSMDGYVSFFQIYLNSIVILSTKKVLNTKSNPNSSLSRRVW